MKHLITFESYASNINEGINFNAAKDADLEDIGGNFANGGDPDNHDEEALIDMGREALKDAKPFPLTGKIKEDATKLIKLCTDAFKRAGVELDDTNTDISSDMDGSSNEIKIPVENQEGYFFFTSLDYYELAANSTMSNIVVGGCFYSDEDGMLDFFVGDLSNNGQIVKAAADFNKYLESKKD